MAFEYHGGELEGVLPQPINLTKLNAVEAYPKVNWRVRKLQKPFYAQKCEDKNVKQEGIYMWRTAAEKLFFEQKKSINEVSKETGVSRQSVSGYLKMLPGYQEERKKRKADNAVKRKEYKREKNRQYREDYRNKVTTETIKREHDIAVMILSHEKYH